MKLVKPDTAPQKAPLGTDAGKALSIGPRLNQVCKQKLTPTNPMMSLMVRSEIMDAVNHPIKTPTTLAGTKIFKLMRLKFLR